jgi:hypothetical protein
LTSDINAARWLLTAGAVRERAHALLARVERGESAHFTLSPERMDAVVDTVLAVMRERYPTMDVPFHSRWRHFEVGGVDRWTRVAATLNADAHERARMRFDLAVVSVLLDAGAGPHWSYREAGGATFTRSEGLGVASFDLFAAGLFSSDPAQPLRCDAAALAALTADQLAVGMQVRPDNPLTGLEGRADLLNRLGRTLSADAAHFGSPGRIGHLYDAMRHEAVAGRIAAARMLEIVLAALGPIWPGRHALAGVPLGDAWPHAAFAPDDRGHGLVPLHKLSQWLTYSLIEPLQEAGITVEALDGLTGLAEYRNGGLLLDAGLLVPRDPGLATRVLPADAEAVVEWRSLTVALLDRVADALRARLGLDAASLPLARVLEGGTWAAGRVLARRLRADGGPPLAIASDGTLF